MPVQGTYFTLDIEGQAAETFAVVEFHLSQSFSTLFTLSITVASTCPAVPLEQLLESNATLNLFRNSLLQRSVRGIVTACEQGDTGKHQTLYELTIRPPLWRTTLRRNSRIFQNTDIEGMVSTLFGEMLVTRWQSRLSSDHPAREFCVQFMENDYDFISRLLAEEGIFTYEEPGKSSQQLILCDSAANLPLEEPLSYHPDPGEETLLFHVTQFRRSARIRPAAAATQDYTFKTPSWPGAFQHQGDNLDAQYPIYEMFDYPGRFKDEAHGQAFTRYQTEGWRNNAETISGKSDSPKLWPGVRFELKSHPRADLNAQWQVVSSELSGTQPQALIGHEGEGTTLTNHFTVIPGRQTWRHAPLSKPQMDGPQTAVVTGPPGEEIFCDEHGRVRVKFTWDRYSPADDSSSCWIRVSQAWAGAGFGNLAIPRVGQEVIVDFLNGDPDQPIIMGRTYHADNLSPGSLPGTKTQMTLRSKTYKGGGYNELMFEDATDQELLSMHAQKDMKTTVLNDQTLAVMRHRTKQITGNETNTVIGFEKTKVKVLQDISVEGDSTHLTGGKRTVQSVGLCLIGSGDCIRLECGDSVMEMGSNGAISITGKSLNISIDGNGVVKTNNGTLGLNPTTAAKGAEAPGAGYKNSLADLVKQVFAETENK